MEILNISFSFHRSMLAIGIYLSYYYSYCTYIHHNVKVTHVVIFWSHNYCTNRCSNEIMLLHQCDINVVTVFGFPPNTKLHGKIYVVHSELMY